jgi:DNA repair exonuclease SbcCD ATPase subunit
MAETRTINLEIKDNFKKVEKDIDDLNESLKDTAENNRDVSKTFEEVYGELQPLTTRMGEAEDRLYELAAAGDTASKEYRDLLQTVGEYRKVQIQTDMAVDAAATTLGQKLGGALGGVTSGFSLAQGAFAAFGDESKEVEEALLKVQSAMAIQQGIQGIREAIPSFKSLATVAVNTFSSMTTASKLFAVTGIGALITAVAYLMGAFDDTAKSVENYASAQQTSNKIQQQAIEDSAKELSALNKLQKQINDETLTREEKNKAVKKLQDAYPDLLKNVNAEKLSINDLNKAVALNIKLSESRGRLAAAESLRAAKFQEILEFELELTNAKEQAAAAQAALNAIGSKAINVEEQLVKKIQERIANAKEQIEQIDGITKADEALIAQVEKQTKVYETETPKVIKEVKKLANYSLQVEKEKIDAMEDGMEKRLALLNFEEKGELAQIDKKGKKAGELTTAIETRYEKERDKVKEEFRVRRDRDDDVNLEAKIANRITTGKLEVEAEKIVRTQIYQMNIEQDEKDKERIKRLNEFRLQSIKDSLQVVSNLTELFAGKSKKQQQKAFQIQKAVNIASAVVDTYKAANTALASSPPPFNYIAMAASITAGIVNVKKIASQKFEGGSGDVGGNNTPSAPETTQAAPQFNTIGSSGVNQLAQLQQQPVQAYVVSGDVTSAQSLDRNRIQNATL